MNGTKIIAMAGAVIAALAITTAAAACGSISSPGTGASAPAAAYTAPSAPVITATPAAATPQYSPAQEQALETALGYLTDGQGFSKAGLLQQLHSSFGNGYSRSLARWAVNQVSSAHLWRRQAVIAAKGYMSDGEGFSYSSLVQQLDSPYGDGFTYAQAVYAAKAVGL